MSVDTEPAFAPILAGPVQGARRRAGGAELGLLGAGRGQERSPQLQFMCSCALYFELLTGSLVM